MEQLTLEEIEMILMYLGEVNTYPMQPAHEKEFIELMDKLKENQKWLKKKPICTHPPQERVLTRRMYCFACENYI